MSSTQPAEEEFTLDLPATALAAAVVRAMAAAVAMAHDIALDVITDIRLAVDEASSILLPLAAPGSRMRCTVQIGATDFRATLQVSTTEHALQAAESVEMLLLRSLAASVEIKPEPVGQDRATLSLRLVLTRD